MSFKLHRYTMLNITKAFLLVGFLLLNFAHGKNSATPNVKAVYYLQHHAFVNKIHHALSYPKKSVTTNHPYLIKRNPHRTLVNHLKMQMFGMPVFFKNRVKNSHAHVKYTFSRDFSVIPPKTGSLFSATLADSITGSAQVKVFVVIMRNNANFAVNKNIIFSVTDSKGKLQTGITLSSSNPSSSNPPCSNTSCSITTGEKGAANVTITNTHGGEVIVTVEAPDGTKAQFPVAFDDNYVFDDTGITAPEKKDNLKNKPVTISVIITKNGAKTPCVPVNWKFESQPKGAFITPKSSTNNDGMAEAYIINPKGGDVTVIATSPDDKTKTYRLKKIYFSKYDLRIPTDNHVEFTPPIAEKGLRGLYEERKQLLKATLKHKDSGRCPLVRRLHENLLEIW